MATMEDGSSPETRFNFEAIPEGCISTIIGFTTPSDACRFALVSKLFLSASESDHVWKKFLPSHYDLIIAASDAGEAAFADCRTKKQIYFRLANTPLLTDGGTRSFSLDKWSGINCWMIGARSLGIEHIHSPLHWQWTSILESRFQDCAYLINEEQVLMSCKIETYTLTHGTNYAAYFVYQISANSQGLDTGCCKASVYPHHGTPKERLVPLAPFLWASSIAELRDMGPNARTDGWLEVKIGEFYTHAVEVGTCWFYMEMRYAARYSGLLVQGIEVRPTTMQS